MVPFSEKRASAKPPRKMASQKRRERFPDPHVSRIKSETRRKVWARSEGKCEYCGLTEAQTAKKCIRFEHEQDEVRPRSLTRDWAPEDRFATWNTARACSDCHGKKTRHEIWAIFKNQVLGMDGSYDVLNRELDVIYRVRR